MRIAAAGLCSLLALGGLTAGANALLSATTDIPFILQPPDHEPDVPARVPSDDRRSLQARELRVPASAIGPTLHVPIANAIRSGQAVPYATQPDLCLVVTPRLARRSSRLPAADTFWNCYDKRLIARELTRHGAKFVYATESEPLLVVGFARRDIARITVRSPGRVMPATMTEPWTAGVPGIATVRLWAAFPVTRVDRTRARKRSATNLPGVRVTATTRGGVTLRVPFP